MLYHQGTSRTCRDLLLACTFWEPWAYSCQRTSSSPKKWQIPHFYRCWSWYLDLIPDCTSLGGLPCSEASSVWKYYRNRPPWSKGASLVRGNSAYPSDPLSNMILSSLSYQDPVFNWYLNYSLLFFWKSHGCSPLRKEGGHGRFYKQEFQKTKCLRPMNIVNLSIQDSGSWLNPQKISISKWINHHPYLNVSCFLVFQ